MKLRNPMCRRYWKLRERKEYQKRCHEERFWRLQGMKQMRDVDNAQNPQEKEEAESLLEMWIQFSAIAGYFYSKAMLRICNQRKDNQMRMINKRIT
jgi:hypothetical protein